MKLLCIGDLHITLDSIEFIGQIFTSYIKNVIQCERVDTIIILGDVLNNDEMAINVREMDCAHQLFKDLSQNIPLYIIVGNHDYIDCHQFLTDRHWMNFLKGTPNVTVVDHVCAVGGAVLVPYVPPGRFQEALNTYPNWKSASVICAHQSFNGAHWKSGICLNGDDWSTDLPPIISGHIHGCQKLDTGVWYPGSIEPTKLNHLAVVEFQEGDSAAIRLIKHFGARAFIGTVEEILKVGNLTNCDIMWRASKDCPCLLNSRAKILFALCLRQFPFLNCTDRIFSTRAMCIRIVRPKKYWPILNKLKTSCYSSLSNKNKHRSINLKEKA